MLTVAFRAQRGLSWEPSPSSSPILGKANGTGNSCQGCTWQAAEASFGKQLFSGSDLRSSALGILLCIAWEGRQSRGGVRGHLCRAAAGLSAWSWPGMELLSLAVSSHSWSPGTPVAPGMP